MPHEAGKPESGWRAPEARDRPNRSRSARRYTGCVTATAVLERGRCRSVPARGPAPTLGQHNHELLCDLIGLSEAEYARLEADGIIGTIYAEDAT